MNTPLTPAAVLFDLDGTLVDSTAAVHRSWHRVCQRYGLDVDAVLRVHAGRQAIGTIRLVAPWLAEEVVREAAAAQLGFEYVDVDDVRALPGAGELLASLAGAGIPVAVVTSCDRRLAGVRMGASGLSVPLVITAEDTPVGKPDPAGYLLAARRLGVPAARCVVVEDAPAGVEAGRRASMTVIGVGGVEADQVAAGLIGVAELLGMDRRCRTR